MEIGNNVIFLLISFYTVLRIVNCTRTSNIIYYDVYSNNTGMCFRRFNATHQIGCTSGRGGNVGVVYYVNSNDSLTELLQYGESGPYIVVMLAELFQMSGQKLLHSTDKINGVVILNTNETDRPSHYSPDTQCPNDGYGVDGSSSCARMDWKWNAYGNGLMFEDFPFPVVMLVHNSSVVQFLLNDCFERYNKPDANGNLPGSQRCGIQIKAVMDGAKDTPTCIRRTNMLVNLSPQEYCDPLGSDNVFASVRPIQENNTNPVIVVAARYDSFSMFDGHYPGADSSTLSFVTLLAVAEAIGKVRDLLIANGTDKHILFVIFNGEAFDYIGSSRMAYDIGKGRMNFTINDIDMFIEIGQIGPHDVSASGSQQLWIHKGLNASQQTEDFAGKLEAVGAKYKLNLTSVSHQPLPPASLQTFAKERINISGVVVTNHQQEFVNRYYNSIFDIPEIVGLNYPTGLNESERYNYVGDLAVHIEKLASSVAQSVYQLATNSIAPDNCTATNTTIANLIYCFAVDPACELFNYTFTDQRTMKAVVNNKEEYLSRYVGVYRHSTISYISRIFALFVGETVVEAGSNRTLCSEISKNDSLAGYRYFIMNGPVNSSDPKQGRLSVCMRSAANYSVALSPAFLDEEDYDWSSNRYSSWSESKWGSDAFRVRIFLMPSYQQELVTFFVGFVLFIASFILVFFVERKSTILFTTTTT